METEPSAELKRLQQAVVDLDRGAIIVDASFRVWWCNNAFLRATGHELDALIGRDVRGLRGAQGGLPAQRVTHGSATYDGLDGEPVRMTSTTVPIFSGDEQVGTLLIEAPPQSAAEPELVNLRQSLQSTESLLRASQQLYRELFENSTDLIQSTDANTRIMYVNDAWCRRLGYTEREAGRLTMSDVLAADQLQDVQLFRCDRPEPLELTSTAFRTRAGERVWVEGRLCHRYVEDVAVGVHAIFRDVTEREELDRMKTQFVTMVNHELRTPLTSISGSLNLLKDGVAGPLEPGVRRFVAIALRNAERLNRLVMEVMDYEKLAAGKLKVRPESVNIANFLHEVVEDHLGYAESHGVPICPLEVEHQVVEVDPALLRHVVGNFLGNALRFAGAQGEVRVGTTAGMGVLRIWVNDTGPGLPDGFRARAFDAFEQASNVPGGTGLGLNIAKTMAAGLGAETGFVTIAGHGATFFVDLPADIQEAPATVNGDLGTLQELVRAIGSQPKAIVRFHTGREDLSWDALLLELSSCPADFTIEPPAQNSQK